MAPEAEIAQNGWQAIILIALILERIVTLVISMRGRRSDGSIACSLPGVQEATERLLAHDRDIFAKVDKLLEKLGRMEVRTLTTLDAIKDQGTRHLATLREDAQRIDRHVLDRNRGKET